jgi:hypothetical protein
MLSLLKCRTGVLLCGILAFACQRAPAQSTDEQPTATPKQAELDTAARQDELDAGLVKMLSGATLEGSFTSTGEGRDPTKLSREKYTLGEVKKLKGNLWQIPARIQYGEHDVTIPLALPIEWAGDTPVIVVDNVGLPGFGAVSARVMFFADHYAGYWKHGNSGGHLFGVIHRNDDDAKKTDAAGKEHCAESGNKAGGEQVQQQPGQQ